MLKLVVDCLACDALMRLIRIQVTDWLNMSGYVRRVGLAEIEMSDDPWESGRETPPPAGPNRTTYTNSLIGTRFRAGQSIEGFTIEFP